MRLWILELKRGLCRRNIFIFFIILLFSLYSTNRGISDYKRAIAKKIEFQKNDTLSAKTINSYDRYSDFGVNVIISPNTSMIFNDNPIIMDSLEGKVNSIITLDIKTNTKGQLELKQNSLFRFRLSNIILFIAVLAFLFFGFDATRNREYLKFLTTHSSPTTAFLAVITTRVVLCVIFILMLYGSALCLTSLAGIPVSSFNFTHVFFTMVAAWLLMFFSLVIGALIGFIRSAVIATTWIFVLWITFTLIFPVSFNLLVDKNNESISNPVVLEGMKLKIMKDFEEGLLKNYSNFPDVSIELKRNLSEHFLKTEFQQLQGLEEQYKQEINALVKKHNSLYTLTPTTFFILTSYESSSLGYSNYIKFYTYLQKLRQYFTRFWIDRVYYCDPSVMQSFVTKDENIFSTYSQVPGTYSTGLIINSLYIMVMLGIVYFAFVRAIYPVPANKENFAKLTLKFSKGTIGTVYSACPDVRLQILNTLFASGPKYDSHKINILLDNKKISLEKHGIPLYIPAPAHIPPEIKVKHLLTHIKTNSSAHKALLVQKKELLNHLLNKPFGKLEALEKVDILLTITELNAVGVKVIVFDDLMLGIQNDLAGCFFDRVSALSEAAIINMVTDRFHCWIQIGTQTSLFYRDKGYTVICSE